MVIVGWLTLWPFLSWLTTHFVVTNRRVMFRHGVLTRSGIDIPLARINSVEFGTGSSSGFSHRDVDYRVRVTRSARVLQHSAPAGGACVAVSRGFRHPGLRRVAQLSEPVGPVTPGPQQGDVAVLEAALQDVLEDFGDAARGKGGFQGLVGVAGELVGGTPSAETPRSGTPFAASCQ